MVRSIEGLFQDFRYAIRSFRRSPGFTLVAILSLTLGIGATASIFSVIYGVLLAPYPYARPGEIWAPQIAGTDGRSGRGAHTIEEFRELQALPAFSDVMATGNETVLLTGEFVPESFFGVLMSGNAFNFLGVPPVIGRTIQPSDIRPDGTPEPVVVISHRLWVRLFNGDPSALGRTLRLNGQPRTIVGVMPPRFGWYGNDGFWLPLGYNQPPRNMVAAIVRLAPGVSQRAATDQLHAFHVNRAKVTPELFPTQGFTTGLRNYLDVTVASGEMRTSLRLLLGAVVFLLLIACANVANLQLARATTRAREMSLRLSIGAGRGRLVRQLLTESVLLSLAGGAGGVLFAFGATGAIVALMPEFYVPNEARVTLNSPVLMFTFAVSVATGIAFGLVPALHGSRPDLTAAMKEGGRSAGAASGGRRTRGLLVVAEVALAMVLLVGAGLTIRTVMALNDVDTGLRATHVMMVGVPLPPAKYPTPVQRNGFAEQLLDRVSALPGVEAATIGNGGNPFGGFVSSFEMEGQPEDAARTLAVNLIGAGHLETFGVPLLQGRAFEPREVARGDRVALINEAAAKLWPAGQNPIGSRLSLGLLAQKTGPFAAEITAASPDFTVVGIVRNTQNNGLRNEPRAAAMIPYTLIARARRVLSIRATTDPSQLVASIRETVRAMDVEQPIDRPFTLTEALGNQLIQPRFTMALFALLAAMGLTLAAAGIYSVLSFHVSRRTHEIGIRVALGAPRADVLRLMIGMGAKLVLAGIAIGVPVSIAAARLLRSQLFGVSTIDPAAYVAVALILAAVALVACYIPARRAAAVDPNVALRQE
jgi:putative ABC transport system permease protein